MSTLPFLFDSPFSCLGVLKDLYMGQLAFLKSHREDVLTRMKNPPSEEEVMSSAKAMLAIDEEFGQFESEADRLTRLAELTSSERPAEEDANEQDLEEAERHIKGIETLLDAIKRRNIPAIITNLQIQIQDLQESRMALETMPEVMRMGRGAKTYDAMMLRRQSEAELLTVFVKLHTAIK